MGSTFLTLTNKLLRRINEPVITEANFASASGVQGLAKEAVNDAINEISESEKAWDFEHVDGAQLLVVGQEKYAWPSGFKMANWDSFYVVKDDALSVNTTKLQEINFVTWTDTLMEADFDSTTTGLNTPSYVFLTKEGGFGVSPSPLQAYTVNFEYYALPTELSAHGDTCVIPTLHDGVIVQMALVHMYMFRDNSTQATLAESKGIKRLRNLRQIYNRAPDRMQSTLAHRRRV